MSVKRQATTELNHENWDQDDPSEHEEMGTFKSASKDVIEKRVIRTAKRRSQNPDAEANKSVFSGFGGFNKTQPSSFDFLANLTNGNKNSNEPLNKSDTSVTSSLFSKKPSMTSPGGIFGTLDNTSPIKTTFGISPQQTTPLFGGIMSTSTVPTGFTASKADSTVVDSPFKIQPVSSSVDTNNTDITKTTNASSSVSTSQVSSTIFGIPTTSANSLKSLFSTSTSTTPYKIQPVSSTTTMQSNFGITTKAVSETNADNAANEVEKKKNAKKIKYYSKLKGLNESVSNWIKKHVEETSLCILSPIFTDYERYLKEIQDEYHSPDVEDEKDSDKKAVSKTTSSLIATTTVTIPSFSEKNTKSVFSTDTQMSKPSIFAPQNNATSIGGKPSFSFGIKASSLSNPTVTNTGFSFGITTPAQSVTANTSSTFTLGTNMTTTSTNGTAPFSFGIGKPFSFSSNIQNNTEQTNSNTEENEEPPKVEFTPIVEDNSIFDKRCKIFVKKDGNFVDKGVGTLFIKTIEESGKHQLLVRANTSLGNILLNLILASAIPTQRVGKNNVMMVCIPTPDSKPPPIPILIRVKTSEEADELLETLNKYKT